MKKEEEGEEKKTPATWTKDAARRPLFGRQMKINQLKGGKAELSLAR